MKQGNKVTLNSQKMGGQGILERSVPEPQTLQDFAGKWENILRLHARGGVCLQRMPEDKVKSISGGWAGSLGEQGPIQSILPAPLSTQTPVLHMGAGGGFLPICSHLQVCAYSNAGTLLSRQAGEARKTEDGSFLAADSAFPPPKE